MSDKIYNKYISYMRKIISYEKCLKNITKQEQFYRICNRLTNKKVILFSRNAANRLEVDKTFLKIVKVKRKCWNN